MVVTELPTTDIKANKIYLVKDSTVAGDLYQEYLYINGAWEKIGTHQSTVELSNYAEKSDTVKDITVTYTDTSASIDCVKGDDSEFSADILNATSTDAGLMTASDKVKLDEIAAITSDELNTILA